MVGAYSSLYDAIATILPVSQLQLLMQASQSFERWAARYCVLTFVSECDMRHVTWVSHVYLIGLNDLRWRFQGHDYSTSNNLKIIQHTALRTMADQLESRVWSIERRHFQWPWPTSTPSFKVTPFFDAKHLINGTTYRHSFNEIPIGTYTRPTQQCHFEWPEWLSKIFNDMKRRAVSLRQLSYLLSTPVRFEAIARGSSGT